MTNYIKRLMILLVLLIIAALSGCGNEKTAGTTKGTKEKITVNIGIQGKVGVLQYARQHKLFEKAFKKENVEIKWHEFTSGPPHFEAIASDRLDFGATGAAPLVSGQAAGIDFRAIGVTGDGRKTNAILVGKGSAYKNIEDLKGKKIAVAPGSSAYYFLYKLLDKNGLTDKDIEIIPLQPDEARAALESGSIDAWSIWEAYWSTAVAQIGAVPIVTSEDLNALSPGFLIARTKFADDHPDLTELFLKTFESARKAYLDHIDSVSKELGASQGINPKIIHKVITKTDPILSPTTKEFAEAFQEQADFLYSEGVIHKKVNVTKVIDNSYVKNALK